MEDGIAVTSVACRGDQTAQFFELRAGKPASRSHHALLHVLPTPFHNSATRQPVPGERLPDTSMTLDSEIGDF